MVDLFTTLHESQKAFERFSMINLLDNLASILDHSLEP